MPAAPLERLLIVDDESELVAPLVLRLSAGGRRSVAAAFDGESGLAAALSFRPDAALVDLSMPGMDGWELCRRLREDPRTRGIRVIIMTAFVTKEIREKAEAAGAAGVLFKPFEEAELYEALKAGAPDGDSTRA